MKKIFSLFLVLFVIACSGRKKDNITPRSTAKVQRGSIRLEVTATGVVKPQVGARVKVGARISGKVERLFVQSGDEVRKGQLIAIIEHKDLEAAMKARKKEYEAKLAELKKIKEVYPAKIRAQRASVKRAEAELWLARLNYRRIKALYEEALVAKAELDEAERDLKVKEARLKEERNKLTALIKEYKRVLEELSFEVQAAKQRYEEAKTRYSYAFIYSPISGVVSSVSTQEGETVVAGLNAPTFITVIDLSRLQVEAYVDETDIGKIKPGQRAEFVVDAYPDKVFKGVVKTIYPGAIIRNNVVFYDVVIEVKTPYVGLLRPEMTADVTIYAGEKKNVLVVPTSAVKVDEKGNTYCFVKEDGRWVKRRVRIGWESGGKTEIVSGLKEGEVVAVW